MNQNQDFRFLHYPLPPDVVRLRESGDLNGAIRLIDKALAENIRPEMAARLRVERERLVRLPAEYPYPKDQAMTMMRKEWPDMTDEQFQALMDNGRVDWRFLNGQIFCHDDFIETSRNYPLEAPGLKSETEDTSARDQMLARMKAEGGLAARITIRASIQPREHAPGARIQAWLPIPAACLQQSEIELLEFTQGGRPAPVDAPQRTLYWDSREGDAFSVTYRYLIRAPYVDLSHLSADPVQPDFCLDEEPPNILFSP